MVVTHKYVINWWISRYLATLNELRSNNNNATVLLPDHTPEVHNGLLQTALRRDVRFGR